MRLTRKVKNILNHFDSENPGVKSNIARLFMTGRLAGTGKVIVYPVDQGFEHGPDRSFLKNADALDPHYHFKLAIDAGLSAYAAPLGWLEAGAGTFAGQIPTILKLNSSNALMSGDLPPDQAFTASIEDALRLGCIGVGMTIYPSSDASLSLYEKVQAMVEQAKACGLMVIIWSYPRGSVSTKGEQALDIISYGAHIASLLGAHIVKVKLPTDHLEKTIHKDAFDKAGIDVAPLENRVSHVVRSCFNGKRPVIFSGGAAKDDQGVLDDARAIVKGGGFGSIIGRNCFQRPRAEALSLLSDMVSIFKG